MADQQQPQATALTPQELEDYKWLTSRLDELTARGAPADQIAAHRNAIARILGQPVPGGPTPATNPPAAQSEQNPPQPAAPAEPAPTSAPPPTSGDAEVFAAWEARQAELRAKGYASRGIGRHGA